MNQRQLLTLGIIAFDVLIKDAIEEDAKGEEFHPVATRVLKYLVEMLNTKPDMEHASQQYILNVSEIGADIKRIFLATPIDDESLREMLKLQAERLKWLGGDRDPGHTPETMDADQTPRTRH